MHGCATGEASRPLKSRFVKWQNPQLKPRLVTNAGQTSLTAPTGAQGAVQLRPLSAESAEQFTKKPSADALNAAP